VENPLFSIESSCSDTSIRTLTCHQPPLGMHTFCRSPCNDSRKKLPVRSRSNLKGSMLLEPRDPGKRT
jgi:hypothetical protein